MVIEKIFIAQSTNSLSFFNFTKNAKTLQMCSSWGLELRHLPIKAVRLLQDVQFVLSSANCVFLECLLQSEADHWKSR